MAIPSITDMTAAQRLNGSKLVDITMSLDDSSSDPLSLTGQYSTDNSSWSNITQWRTQDIYHDGLSNISVPAIGHNIVWDAYAQLGASVDDPTVWAKITVSDGTDSTSAICGSFPVDTIPPVINSFGINSLSVDETGTYMKVKYISGTADSSTTALVNLDMSTSGASYMRFSNDIRGITFLSREETTAYTGSISTSTPDRFSSDRAIFNADDSGTAWVTFTLHSDPLTYKINSIISSTIVTLEGFSAPETASGLLFNVGKWSDWETPDSTKQNWDLLSSTYGAIKQKLASGITATSTSISLQLGVDQQFETFNQIDSAITWWLNSNNRWYFIIKIGDELIRTVYNTSYTTYVVERGIFGTTAQAHNAGDTILMCSVRPCFFQIKDAIGNLTNGEYRTVAWVKMTPADCKNMTTNVLYHSFLNAHDAASASDTLSFQTNLNVQPFDGGTYTSGKKMTISNISSIDRAVFHYNNRITGNRWGLRGNTSFYFQIALTGNSIFANIVTILGKIYCYSSETIRMCVQHPLRGALEITNRSSSGIVILTSAHVLIEKNILSAVVWYGSYYSAVATIRNNIFILYWEPPADRGIRNSVSFPAPCNLRIINNTFRAFDFTLIIAISGPIGTFWCINNVFYGDNSALETRVFLHDAGSSSMFRNNNMYNIPVSYRYSIMGNRTDLTGINGNVSVDPKFVSNSVPGDFHVQSTSGIIDIGANQTEYADVPTYDYDEVKRPQAAGTDIGAYEKIMDLSRFDSSSIADNQTIMSTANAASFVTRARDDQVDTYADSTSKLSMVKVKYEHEDGRQQRQLLFCVGDNFRTPVSWSQFAKDGTWQKTEVKAWDHDGAVRVLGRDVIGTSEDITHSGGTTYLNI